MVRVNMASVREDHSTRLQFSAQEADGGNAQAGRMVFFEYPEKLEWMFSITSMSGNALDVSSYQETCHVESRGMS